MPDEKQTRGSELSPLILAAGAGAVGAWLWWRNRQPLPTSNNMSGRVCVVTGANAGIGKATATALAQQGAHVVLACRSTIKGDAACEEIRRKVPGAAVQTLPLDLEDVDSIRYFVKLFRQTHLPLHVLVNNAGIILGKPESVRGMEKTVVVNHLGPFLLTNLLLRDLREGASSAAAGHSPGLEGVPGQAPASRIVTVASKLEKRGILSAAADHMVQPGVGWFLPSPGKQHDAFQLYGTSKLCNMLFTFELERRLSAAAAAAAAASLPVGGRVTANAVTPGIVNTKLGDGTVSPLVAWAAAPLKALFMRKVEKGAETVVWAATSQAVETCGGKFFGDMKEVPCSDASKDEGLARTLWQASELAVGLAKSEREV